MHRGRPMREAFDHCPTSRIRQSRKGCIQPIHNHMVVDILRVSSTHFAKNRPALLEIDSVTISRHGSRTCLSGPVEPQPDLPWRSRQSAMYSLTASASVTRLDWRVALSLSFTSPPAAMKLSSPCRHRKQRARLGRRDRQQRLPVHQLHVVNAHLRLFRKHRSRRGNQRIGPSLAAANQFLHPPNRPAQHQPACVLRCSNSCCANSTPAHPPPAQ